VTLLFWSRTPNRVAQGARRGDEPPGQFVFPAGATRRRGTLSGRHALKPSAQYSRARRMCSLSASSMAMALAGGGIGNYRGRMCKVDPSLALYSDTGFLRRNAPRGRVRDTLPVHLRALPVRVHALLCPFLLIAIVNRRIAVRPNSRDVWPLATVLFRRKKYRSDRHLRTKVTWPTVALLLGHVLQMPEVFAARANCKAGKLDLRRYTAMPGNCLCCACVRAM
jgi:hypothetical protein